MRVLLAAFALLAPCLCSGIASSEEQQTVLGHQSRTAYVRAMLKIADIIPDVIDDFQPSILVQIAYPASHESASLGNYIDPKDVQTKPTVLLQADPDSEVAEDTLFTVIMTDPDAPSRQDPKWSEMCHWIATNITLLPSANSSPHPDADLPSRSLRPAPAELIEYYPPGPPPKTGPHRYVFLVFKPRNGTTSHLSPPPDRKRWGYGKVRHGVRKWATENDLIPVGGDFFHAQNAKQ